MKQIYKLSISVLICALLIGMDKTNTYASENNLEVSISGQYFQENAREMIHLINDFRSEESWYWNCDNETKTYTSNLTKLMYDYELERVAMQRAAEIAVKYEHERPNGEKFYSLNDYNGYAGENIAITYEDDIEKVFELWKEENEKYEGQGHRRCMLNHVYNAVGIGHFYFNGAHFWVQEFNSNVMNTTVATTIDATKVPVLISLEELENISIDEISTETITIGEEGYEIKDVGFKFRTYSTWPTTSMISGNVKNLELNIEDDDIAYIDKNRIVGIKDGQTNLLINVLNESYKIPINVDINYDGYSDVFDVTGWKYDSIKFATQNEIMFGDGLGAFMPNDNLTRAMFSTIIYRIENEPEIIFENIFNDVIDFQYYSNAVTWANRNNIIYGYGDGRFFGPNDKITRQDLITMLYRYADSKGYDVSANCNLTVFADKDGVEKYAEKAMQWAVANGIITGKYNKWLDASGNATRVEAAAIIMRFMQLYNSNN